MKIGQDEIRRVRFLLSYIFFFGALGGPAWGKASDGSVCVEPVLGVRVGGERPGGGTFFSLGCFFGDLQRDLRVELWLLCQGLAPPC